MTRNNIIRLSIFLFLMISFNVILVWSHFFQIETFLYNEKSIVTITEVQKDLNNYFTRTKSGIEIRVNSEVPLSKFQKVEIYQLSNKNGILSNVIFHEIRMMFFVSLLGFITIGSGFLFFDFFTILKKRLERGENDTIGFDSKLNKEVLGMTNIETIIFLSIFFCLILLKYLNFESNWIYSITGGILVFIFVFHFILRANYRLYRIRKRLG